MKVIASSTHYGVFWHSAPNSRGDTEHVVVYGLQVDSQPTQGVTV